MGREVFQRSAFAAALVLVGALTGCGGGGSKPAPTDGPECAAGKTSFDSTFAAIQTVVFERHGCTKQACHGEAAQGGLDLSPGAAYASLVEAPSLGSRLLRVEPGGPTRSYLLMKLAAATEPGSVEITGAPMPNGLPPLSKNELEAVRIWIKAGAPEHTTVGDAETGSSKTVADLLDACLPPAEPVTIKPLDPPPAGAGVQFVMPQYELPAGKEMEVCFATYYDFTDQVPREFQDPTGTYFRYGGTDMRQDPQSHHLVLDISETPIGEIHDPSFGTWTCKGGEHDGEACEPTDRLSCNGGVCGSEAKPAVGCIGFGPERHALTMGMQGIGGGMTSQLSERFSDGVFAQVPLRGVFYWNSHAFNLTTLPHRMNARVNFTFATRQDHLLQRIPVNIGSLYQAAGTAPFTKKTVCSSFTPPQHARLTELTSHTHKRGKDFTAQTPNGEQIYESLAYNDPKYQHYDPPLAFDSTDPAERRIRYCGLFNNGVGSDGSPDPETVTRASRMPDRASCHPVACAAGRIGESCGGADDDATCDTAPGAGDGDCDACAITAGVTTENEMFLLLGWFYVDAP